MRRPAGRPPGDSTGGAGVAAGRTLPMRFGPTCARGWRRRGPSPSRLRAIRRASWKLIWRAKHVPSLFPTPRIARPAAPCWQTSKRFGRPRGDLPQEEPSPRFGLTCAPSWRPRELSASPACAQFDAELEAYLEGEARPFIVSHAQDCAPCGALLADLQAIRQAARELPQEEPSRVVWANVRARLEAEGAFGAPVSGWRQILAWRIFPHAGPPGSLEPPWCSGISADLAFPQPPALGQLRMRRQILPPRPRSHRHCLPARTGL